MNNQFKIIILIIILNLLGCNGYDSQYFPYAMKGLDVVVYNENGKEFFAGHIEASYKERFDALDRCQLVASTYARDNHMDKWGYVCCTVISSDNCLTKVR